MVIFYYCPIFVGVVLIKKIHIVVLETAIVGFKGYEKGFVACHFYTNDYLMQDSD